MGAHTPGPWKAADPGDYGDYNGECIVVLGDHKRVAVVLGYGPESQADARLIAAAPDLLEAARKALKSAEREKAAELPVTNGRLRDAAIHDLRAALAKFPEPRP
jgi:hypothetical protein